ncbi:hypothetical protein [Terricaulis sp.]|uniref:hypothetical protein n=1 Tax=Terricaulis sp. TaxID=2768686 RepID=UPI003783F98A
MFARLAAAVCAVLILAGCDAIQGKQGEPASEQTTLDTPGPDTETARVFTPGNPAATSATGQLNYASALRLGDAAGAEPQEVLTLTGATGLVITAEVTATVSPATQVQGQTLRALLVLPVEEPQVIVYRVTNETKPANGQGLCGADAASHVVVWEPTAPGEAALKVMGFVGGAPGAAGARACPMLQYARQ